MTELTTPKAILISGILVSFSIMFQGQIKLALPNLRTGDPSTLGTQTKYKNVSEAFIDYAGQIGLDKTKFQACINTKKYESDVTKDYADGQAAKVSGTPTLYINGIQVVGAVPYEQLKTIIDNELAGKTPSTQERIQVANANGAVLGQDSAALTIVEFSDFQCPYCKRLFDGAWVQLKKDYVDTGKVKVVFRDFPLYQIHKNAGAAALAGQCAKEQGKFWDMHDKLFTNQDEWSSL